MILRGAIRKVAPPTPGRVVLRAGRGVPRQTATFTRATATERKMARALLASLRAQASRVPLSQLIKIVASATPEQIYEAASAGGAEAMAVQLQAAEMDAVMAGGDLAGKQLAGPNVVINLGRPGVKDWLQDKTARLIKDVTETQREAVRLMIEDGLARGRHPTKLAKDIKQAVSLNKKSAQALINRRNSLLADGMSADKVDKKVAQYADKLLKRRAETIARTESMSAVNHGRLELWEQLKESGDLPSQIEAQWLTADDERTCEWCGPLHLQRQALGKPWTSSERGLTYTVKAPPLHINCRCTLALIEEGEEENL